MRPARRIFILARRWTLLWALLFWQGGFMFYGGVVVPIGGQVLGSDREQGFITAEVTNYLNLAGAVALALWLWNLLGERGTSPRWHRLRGVLWSLLVLSLLILVWQHRELDAVIDAASSQVHDRSRFGLFHSGYLFVSTVQWMGCLALSALTIRTWQEEDAADRPVPRP